MDFQPYLYSSMKGRSMYQSIYIGKNILNRTLTLFYNILCPIKLAWKLLFHKQNVFAPGN